MNQHEQIIAELKVLKPDIFDDDSPDSYLNRVWSFIEKLPKDKIVTVTDWANTETVNLFTAVVKYYIIARRGNTVRFLRNDYKQFRKN